MCEVVEMTSREVSVGRFLRKRTIRTSFGKTHVFVITYVIIIVPTLLLLDGVLIIQFYTVN